MRPESHAGVVFSGWIAAFGGFCGLPDAVILPPAAAAAI